MSKSRRGWGALSRLPTSSFESSAFLNDKTFTDIYNRMQELALNLFVYDNLPDTCDVRYLELMLYEIGYCYFFREDISEIYLTLAGTMTGGKYDVYGNYTDYTAISFNGNYRVNLNAENSVIIYNNFTRIPTKDQVMLFAWRAWNALRTADTNLAQQKTTKLLKVPQARRLTFANILMKIKGNEIYALVDDSIDVEQAVIDFNVPFIADKAMNAYNAVWNEYLTFLGVVNHNSDKKEREVQIEVMGHMGQTEMCRTTMLRSREIGVDRINKMFGLNINVRFNSDLANFFMDNKIDYEWGEENIDIHDYNQTDSGGALDTGKTDRTED